jgi:hypothetical protein
MNAYENSVPPKMEITINANFHKKELPFMNALLNTPQNKTKKILHHGFYDFYSILKYDDL